MSDNELYDELDDTIVAMLRKKDIALMTNFTAALPISFVDEGANHTDGKGIFINKHEWANWDIKTRAGVLLHEALHIALFHIPTIKELDLDPKKANYAGDYQINIIIKDWGLTLPYQIYDDKYRDMGFEEIYNLLGDPPEDYEPDLKIGDGDGEGEDGESDTSPSAEELENYASDKLIEAAVNVERTTGDKSYGEGMPAALQRILEKIRNPKLPWNVLLRKFFTSKFGKTKSSFNKRNRRFRTAVVPTKSSKGMGKVSFYEDLSGSITEREHSLQVAEMQYIQTSLEPEEITFNGFTHVLGETQYFSRGRPMVPDWNITGGTNIRPVLLDIIDKQPQVAIIFTDGCFNMPEDVLNQINNPIIWVIVNNDKWTASKGEVLHMSI